MRRRWLTGGLAGLIAAALPSATLAQDHLQPIESDVLSTYGAMLRQVFAEIYADRSQASAIVIPSFSPEEAIAIEARGSEYTLLVLTPAVHLWGYEVANMLEGNEPKEAQEIRDGLPENPSDVRLERCRRELSRSTGKLLVDAWGAVLHDVRPADPDQWDTIVLDGTSYEFWHRGPNGEKAGRIYAPQSGRVQDMASLAHKLVRFCDGRARERELVSLARDVSEAD